MTTRESASAVIRRTRPAHWHPSRGNRCRFRREQTMDYRILGPLEAHDGDRALSLGGSRQRAVLALLLLHGNEALTRDLIIDKLWGESPPPTAAKVLQNCVSALRKELPGGAERLRTFGTSYALELEPG